MAKPKKVAPRRLEGRVLAGLPVVESARLPGFAFEPFDDDLFALGYPHLALLHDDEDDPVEVAEQLVLEGYPYRDVVFPRRAAVGLVRAYRQRPFVLLPTGKPQLVESAAAALRRTDALALDEASELVSSFAAPGIAGVALDTMLYLVESLVGTRETIEFMLAATKRFPPANFFRASQHAAMWVTTMAMMLERCPDATSLREQACAWADSAGLDPAPRAFTGVGTLHGEPRVEAPFGVVRASRDAVVNARRADATSPWYGLPDPRLVFLGGDAVYEVELALWPKYGAPYSPSKAHRLILERFGRIQSPLTVALVSAMADKSRAKKEALAWLEQRRDAALPALRSLASAATPYAAACANALKRLGEPS
jgi:hypothetical protein